MSLGGTLGGFTYAPPPQYAGLYEAVESDKCVTLIPFRCLGHRDVAPVFGPPIMSDFESFVPAPIDTSKITLPDSIESISSLLAKNIHEVWSKNKIEAGYSYGEVSRFLY